MEDNSLIRHIGGCHCGAVRFAALAPPKVRVCECNCSVCVKKQIKGFLVPAERFEILQGKDNLTEYTFNTGIAKHWFCETQSSLSFQFRIAQNTTSGIIKLAGNALVKVLSPNHLHVPSTKTEWEAMSAAFYTMWQFSQYIGALDGKHIKISPPPNSGSLYYNYKGDFSIVLMALVDANLKFLFVDVGTNGRISDGGVWGKCKLKSALDKNTLNILVANTLPLTNTKVPYVIVADDAFPLSFNLMKPYPGRGLNEEERIFNYRLSRARRISENAFGILATRFQIFKQRILTTPMNATKIVLSCCALHNFLISNNSNIYIPPCSIDVELIENKEIQRGDWKGHYASEAVVPLLMKKGNPGQMTKDIRQKFCRYFNGVGAVKGQNDMCLLH
ncbi:Centromere protein V like protein [Argiope bruennichi]|uniref:Centromere protein V like protein n=1 Tax=Argiope bruennichi TaxID=94029 RepID=A0A8T0F6P8_ARGBR|nr:Centromere protein V like protein [Argiope bruennichi]